MRLLWMFTLIVISSCRQFLPQNPQITKEELPDGCIELYDFIQNNWKKHRSNPCHVEVPNAFVLADRYRDCFEQLNRNQIEGIFGQPDKIDYGTYFYFMKKDCRDMSPNGSYYLKIAFNDETVRWVTVSYTEFIE